MLNAAQIKELRAAKLTGKNKVLKARELAKQTQAELAEALGITQAYVSAIERNVYGDLPLETTRSFSDHFGCAIEDLFPAKQGAVA